MAIHQKNFDDGSSRLVDGATANTVMYADGTSRVSATKINSVARTDTSAKNLFKIPANAIPIGVRVWGGTLSNAGTTATVSVGKTGTNTHFVNAFDVKGGTAAAQNYPTASNLFASVGTAEIQVVGIYAETGTASSAGGPWYVAMDYYLP